MATMRLARGVLILCAVLSLAACTLSPSASSSKPTPTATPRQSGVNTYITTKDTLYALDTRDGEIRWHTQIDSSNEFSRVLNPNGKVVLVTTEYNRLLAIRAADGALLWRRDYPNYFASASDELAIFGSYSDPSTNRLTAVNVDTGQTQWSRDVGLAWTSTLVDGTSVIAGLQDYGVTCSNGTPFGRVRILALSALDGAKRWSIEISRQPEHLWDVESDAGIVYWSVGDSGEGCAIHPNHLYAADQATGKLLWQTDTDDDYSFDAIADGLIFGNGRGGLSARRASDGVLLWQASDLGFIHADRQVMLAERRNSDESELVSLDPTSGKDLWAVADTNESYNVFRDDEFYGVKYPPGTQGHLSVVARTLSTGGIHWEATLPLDQSTDLAWRDSKLLALQADYHACSGGITSDVTVTAFDAATGRTLWMRVLPRIAASETPVPSPTIHARMLC